MSRNTEDITTRSGGTSNNGDFVVLPDPTIADEVYLRNNGSASASASAFSGDDDDDDSLSIISGFELLAVDGTAMKKCLRCTFLNGQTNAKTCEMCQAALVANPFQKVDHELARNVQSREQDAKKVRVESAPKPTLVNISQTIVDKLVGLSADKTNSNTPGVSFCHLETSLIHVHKFVKDYESINRVHSKDLYVGFAFTDKKTVSRTDCNDILSVDCFVSDSAMVAYNAFKDQARGKDGYPPSLATPIAPPSANEDCLPCTGWVFLIQALPVDSDTKIVRVQHVNNSTTLHFLAQSTYLRFLPLMSFDTSYFSVTEFPKMKPSHMVPDIRKVLEDTLVRRMEATLVQSDFLSSKIRNYFRDLDLFENLVEAMRSVGDTCPLTFDKEIRPSSISGEMVTSEWDGIFRKSYVYECTHFLAGNYRIRITHDKATMQINRVDPSDKRQCVAWRFATKEILEFPILGSTSGKQMLRMEVKQYFRN